MTRLVLRATAAALVACSAPFWGACTETVVKTIPAPDSGGASEPEGDSGSPVVVNPDVDASVTDSGLVGRRLGDVGCQEDDDCDSNVCFLGATTSFCTRACSPATAAADCPAPLAGTCSRQFLCDR